MGPPESISEGPFRTFNGSSGRFFGCAQNDMGVDCQIEERARENLSLERKGFDVCS